MSTWRIFSDANNSYRWECCDPNILLPSPEHTLPELPDRHHTPDADLMRVGSKVAEDCDVGERQGVFRTGLGKKVEVKQSSIDRARSVLGELDFDEPDLGECVANGIVESADMKRQSFGRADGCNTSDSLFKTASGKTVEISPLGLTRAKALLELDREEQDFISPAKSCVTNELPDNSSRSEGKENDAEHGDPKSVSSNQVKFVTIMPGSEFRKYPMSGQVLPVKCSSNPEPPPIKFHTAGGRSISVSGEALKLARSLLGDPDTGEISTWAGASSVTVPLYVDRSVSDQGSASRIEIEKANIPPKSFVSPLRSSPPKLQLCSDSQKTSSGRNLIDKFNEEAFDCAYKSNDVDCLPRPKSGSIILSPNAKVNMNSEDNLSARPTSRRPLLDVSNKMRGPLKNKQQKTGEKRKLVRRNFPSQFKRPRSRFSAPLINNGSVGAEGPLITVALENSICKQNVSTRYPVQATRLSAHDYLGVPSSQLQMSVPQELNRICPDNAQNYVFSDGASSAGIGVERFADMLVASGAKKQHASKEWVANHYRWIIWKLASYDRRYPAKPGGNFLSVTNVLKELKYRYEREVYHGHRSAIKRIVEGDTSPSSMMVLCISAIYSNHIADPKSSGTDDCKTAKVQLTDGWYSIDGVLDVLLLKQLAKGKLFVGQKLRVWGARFCGWIGPVSPLEAAKKVSLLLQLNGTYRAHWADRLGLCKSVGDPLAFGCIKVSGGHVPQTLVVIKRIYPLLYKERFPNGGSVIRSEKLEAKARHSFNQRRLSVVEAITSYSQMHADDRQTNNESDSEENAKLLKKLETAAEPETLMAEMSQEQQASFRTYHAKLKEIRHLNMDKSITKALADAGLTERNVSAFMRVKVAGLWSQSCRRNNSDKEGIVTIWEPNEKQMIILRTAPVGAFKVCWLSCARYFLFLVSPGDMQHELVEGQAYVVSGILALSSDSSSLYCSARGSSSRWRPLSLEASRHFETSYVPRKPVYISNLGHVSMSSEFDMAGLVVHIGEVFKAAHQKKQWMFVTDCSISELPFEDLSYSLLAINICLTERDDDLFVPINSNLVGSTVGFCNIVKEANDQQNQMWVAKMTENSIYYLNYDLPCCSHLKDAAVAVTQWSSKSKMLIERLRQKVLSVVGD